MVSAESLGCKAVLGLYPSCRDSGVGLGSISVLSLEITHKHFHEDGTHRIKARAGNRNVDS